MKFPRRIFLKGFLWSALVVCLAAFLIYEAITWPDVSALRTKNPKTTAFIELYKKKQEKAGRKPYVSWRWAAYSEISPNLKRATLVAEDINFFSHHGFDFEAISDSVQDAVKEGEKPRGASTVSQQVVKNLWLSPSRNYFRKIKEALLTIQIERTLKKRRILEIYLNVVEFGPGIYGAEAAFKYYFKKHASELSDEEAAELAASLPAPRYWHPGSGNRYYNYRVGLILRKMQTQTFINRWI
jgi:monofunctional biosynthetic peptidoglycan transglycosylase